MARRRRAPRYTGILATPIPAEASDRAYRAAVASRFRKLFEEYLIPQGPTEKRMALLAWALSYQHVPGFRLARKNVGGANKAGRWDTLRLLKLYCMVEAEMVKMAHTNASKALRRVAIEFGGEAASMRRTKSQTSYEQYQRTLYRQFMTAKRRWPAGPHQAIDDALSELKRLSRRPPKGALEDG